MGLLDLFKKKEEVKDTQYDVNFNNDEQFTSVFDEPTTEESPAPASGASEFIVEDVFSITGRGTVVTGQVTAGTFDVNDTVIINGNRQVKLVGIEMFRKTLGSCTKGDNAGLLLADVKREEINRGDVITK